MHPDLLNNSLFLRYYGQWQKNPESIVFAPIADYLLNYNLTDDAQKICEEGLKRHPSLTVGHIVMAKIHMKRQKLEEAEEELRLVLQIAPGNRRAGEMMVKLEDLRKGGTSEIGIETPPSDAPPSSQTPSEWQTVTMAGIYAEQGHVEKAREIYLSVLERDPQNETALKGLASINS